MIRTEENVLTPKTFKTIGGLATLMFGMQMANTLTGYGFNAFGLLPRSLLGLRGILISPFLHGSWMHLGGNLLPFVLLSAMVAADGLRRYLTVSLSIVVIGGLLVWVFGRYSLHVGASGWVFGLWVYILARAWYRRSWLNLLTAVAALLFYSGMIYGFVPRYGVSFESHIAGAVAGFGTARLFNPVPHPATAKKEN